MNEVYGLRSIRKHILSFQKHMLKSIINLQNRMIIHDDSKYGGNELELVLGKYDLDSSEFGTPSYDEQLKKVYNSLSNHYNNNSHHPQYYENGVDDMSIFDLLEMLNDWYAASENGIGIDKSIEFNSKRFNIDNSIVRLLRNTVKEIEGV